MRWCHRVSRADATVVGVALTVVVGAVVAAGPAMGVSAAGTTMGASAAGTAVAVSAETSSADAGWATQAGGTVGGSAATATHTYTVSTRAQLLAAIAGTDPATGKTDKKAPKIIRWIGAIDMTEGRPYADHDDQAARGEVKLQPNTTIIGVGSDAYLPNGWFMVRGVDNVIIRNIKVTNPCDTAPKWDSGDGAGNYNSEFDGATVDGASHVWIDHMWFTDAPFTDDQEPLGNRDKNGVAKHIQCHDGALDVKNASDYVTISNTIFEEHDKTTLVGSSDSRISDEGHLTVSFLGNLYRNAGQRAPRVRFGEVHLAGNYFVGSRTDAVYPYQYSVGIGLESKIISGNNVFDISGVTPGSCREVVKNPNTSNPDGGFVDSGSLVNGVALAGCTAPTQVGWSLPSGYRYTEVAVAQVRESVLANAGTGRI